MKIKNELILFLNTKKTKKSLELSAKMNIERIDIYEMNDEQ